MHWYLKVLRNYVNFSGRARRKEYWMFVLFNFIIAFGLGFISGFLGAILGEAGSVFSLLPALYNLAVFLPSLAVSVRRLHDTDRTGWWILINLIPLVGWIIFIVFMVLDSTPGSNTYGPNPKGSEPAAAV